MTDQILCPKGHGNLKIDYSKHFNNYYSFTCKECGAYAPKNEEPVKWYKSFTAYNIRSQTLKRLTCGERCQKLSTRRPYEKET